MIGWTCQQEQLFISVIANCSKLYPTVDVKGLDEVCLSPNETSTEKDIKCFVKCMGEGIGIASPDGKIIESKLKTVDVLDPEKSEEAIKKCAGLVKVDVCDTAYDQYRCLCEFM